MEKRASKDILNNASSLEIEALVNGAISFIFLAKIMKLRKIKAENKAILKKLNELEKLLLEKRQGNVKNSKSSTGNKKQKKTY